MVKIVLETFCEFLKRKYRKWKIYPENSKEPLKKEDIREPFNGLLNLAEKWPKSSRSWSYYIKNKDGDWEKTTVKDKDLMLDLETRSRFLFYLTQVCYVRFGEIHRVKKICQLPDLLNTINRAIAYIEEIPHLSEGLLDEPIESLKKEELKEIQKVSQEKIRWTREYLASALNAVQSMGSGFNATLIALISLILSIISLIIQALPKS